MARFVNETFTDNDGTALSSHSGEVGATWTIHTNFGSSAALITDANRLRNNVAGLSVYHASGSPANANYLSQATIRVVTKPATGYLGVCARIDTAASTFYFVEYNLETGKWELFKGVAGSFSIIDDYTQSLTIGNDYVVRLDTVGSLVRMWIDGVLRLQVQDTSITAAGKPGLIAYQAVTNSTGMHLADFSTDDVNPDWMIVCDGDSITSGYGLTPDLAYPSVMSFSSNNYVVNYGVAGQTCATMITNGATKVDPLYSASRNQNICVCFAGTNDMAIGGVSAATAIARISQYCSDRRSAGWKVVVCTILPRGDNDIETRRATVNADILASVGVYSDAVANVAGDSRIGDSGDEDDLTYYSADTVHPNAAGAAVIAGIVQAAIESLAASGGTYRMDNRLMRPRRF